ncbi:MAG: hypothetical protein ACM3SS_00720 [Rhodospirillaceae bacterium]
MSTHTTTLLNVYCPICHHLTCQLGGEGAVTTGKCRHCRSTYRAELVGDLIRTETLIQHRDAKKVIQRHHAAKGGARSPTA